MRFLIDENIHVRVVTFLRAEGHDVLSILETHSNISDEEVLLIAIGQQRILITHDTDFGEMIFRDGSEHCGVVLLRPGNEKFEHVRDSLSHFLNKHSEEEIIERVWSIAL
jgi:predicted nuclease of predicted toxin-antitoxin system